MASANKRPPYQPRHVRSIAVISRNGRVDHFSLADAGPVNGMPRSHGKLRDELALRPTVAFPKWVQHIDLTQVVPCSLTKDSRQNKLTIF